MSNRQRGGVLQAGGLCLTGTGVMSCRQGGGV